ncbi:MAG TPA: porphobilinogen synthase [Aggregatilineales bacterium]|nr:porphobilinogen synthase [Aggregatilineales bacterium]
MSVFPAVRPRRLRNTTALRSMVTETTLSATNFIYPLFVVHGRDVHREIPSMPDVYHLSIDRLHQEIDEISELGIPSVILFGIPAEKDPIGEENFAEDGIVQQAVRAIKQTNPEIVVMTDVCMCEYTDHGHCGIVRGDEILNDETLEILQRVAVSHAQAGADVVAPSGMMDGMVKALRGGLDQAGYMNVNILSYAVKYASSFYGPFRDAVQSTPAFGDRRTHQMNPANAREALREARLDVEEGADMLMVKPALPYLDVIYRLRENFDLPLAAYNVSGEYSMVKAAAEKGWLDERRVVLEALTGIRRAGADMILTYHAKCAARWLQES